MLKGPHRTFTTPVVRDRVRVSVEVRIRDVLPEGTGPVGLKNVYPRVF